MDQGNRSLCKSILAVGLGFLLMTFYGSATGVASGLSGFALPLGIIEAALYQWSLQIDDYNRNNIQALSIIKAWIYVISQGS